MNLIEVQTSEAPGAVGPYSQAVRSEDLIFFSGQLPIDPATSKIESAAIEGQTVQVLSNIRAILQSQGLDMQNVVMTAIMLKDLADFDLVNKLYAEAFPQKPFPARSTFQVAALPKGALVEIEGMAIR